MNVLEFDRVSVRYREQRIRSLKELMVRTGAKVRRFEGSKDPSAPSHPRAHEPSTGWFDALHDISLTIHHGEAVGIVGPNGAGKSTLLRVAAGMIPPSSGVAISRGTMAPVMELGTGFEAELSGRENIYFNGALLGCSRAYMRSRVDEIIAFSGIEHFIDAPLRTYSTGMVARLAFAVATAIDAETVLLDEILAVGDESFRAQCRARIDRFVHNGATVIVVSHELEPLERLCTRAIWISGGRIVEDGGALEVIERYRRQSSAVASA